MGTKRDVEIGILLDEAQGAHRCLAAHDRKLKAALDRRTPNQLVCPRSHLYARKGYWDGLSAGICWWNPSDPAGQNRSP